MSKEVVKVPDIGDYEGVDVIEVLVKVGDEISAEDPIVSLETDKATMEVPSPVAGKVLAVHIKEGGKVSEGDVLIDLESGSESSSNSADVKTQEQEDTSQKSSEESSKDNAEDTSSASSEEVVSVPDIGDYDSVDVIEVLVKAGDEINAEDPLISLETDKATMEVPSPLAGKVLDVMVKEGGKVSKGDAILKLAIAGSASNDKKVVEKKAETIKEQEVVPAKPAAQAIASSGEEVKAGLAHASPSVRRFARELGADVSNISGSGPKGRITQEDVQKYIKGKMQSMGSGGGGAGLDLLPDHKVDFAQFGEVEVEKLSRINKISAANLHRNWVKIPHITLFDDADITEMDSFRKASKQEALDKGVKLTPLAFIVELLLKH